MKSITYTLIFTVVLSYAFSAYAQDNLILPKKHRLAIDKQTRQTDGKPGKNYWQNSSDYFIKVNVDVEKKIISGTEKIVYTNNSPDSIKTMVIRLYQDVFKKGANRNALADVNPLDIHDGVNISNLQVNRVKVDEGKIKRQGTLMFVPLSKKLAPKSKIELDIAWDFKFPQHTLIRMGTIDSTSLFVAQWYPQVSVYDDIYGWDTWSYNGMSEFYNDFSNFEVEISVPDKFTVWATGELLNMNEVLQPAIIERYRKASAAEEIVQVITPEDLKNGKVTTQTHTWRYKASDVPDFAFGVSDHYVWDVCSVVVDKSNAETLNATPEHSNRRTIVGAAYRPDAVHFTKVAEIARETVKYLSEQMPGVPYPYPYLTAFHGDFGMEYPMITNVGPDEDYGTTVYAHSHEIAHAYFPFLVGTNETKNGWLDEGLVVYMPENIQSVLSPGYNVAKNNTAAFSAYAGMEDEVALITPTHLLDPRIYFYLNYAKTEVALRMLEMQVGSDVFKKSLQTFIERWKYKHPTPADFFNTFNDVSGQNLNWFWESWYYQNGGIPDLAISNVEKKDNRYTLTIENRGDFPLPVVISFYNKDWLVRQISETPGKWKKGEKTIKINFDSPEEVTHIRLGNEIIPDANKKDNEYKF